MTTLSFMFLSLISNSLHNIIYSVPPRQNLKTTILITIQVTFQKVMCTSLCPLYYDVKPLKEINANYYADIKYGTVY